MRLKRFSLLLILAFVACGKESAKPEDPLDGSQPGANNPDGKVPDKGDKGNKKTQPTSTPDGSGTAGIFGLTGALNIGLTSPNVAAPRVFADDSLGLKGKPTSTPNVASKFAQAAPGPMAGVLAPALSPLRSLTAFTDCTPISAPPGFTTVAPGLFGAFSRASMFVPPDPLLEIWDRFFDGCGPSDVFQSMKDTSTQLSSLLTKIAEGGARCLSMPSQPFSGLVFPRTTTEIEETFHLSCIDARTNDETAVAYGLKDGYFYFAEGSYPTKLTGRRGVNFLKIKQDGSEIDLWRPIGSGNPEQSVGLVHLKATIGASPAESGFSFTGVGRNIGPGCGFFIKSKGDFIHVVTLTPGGPIVAGSECKNSYGTPDNPATTGENEEWSDFKTKATSGNIFCLKKDPSNAAAFVLVENGDAVACGGAGVYNAEADVPLLHYTAYPDTPRDPDGAGPVPTVSYDDANTFGKEIFTEGASVLNLTSWRTQDPVFVIRERLFNSGPTDVSSMLAAAKEAVDTKLVPFFAQEKLPQCAFEKPISFNTNIEKDGLAFNFNLPFSLSCVNEQGQFLGSLGRADTFFAEAGQDGNLRLLRQSKDGSITGLNTRIPAGSENAGTWADGTGMLFSYLIDSKTGTTEYTIVGERNTGIGCGIHAKTKGNLLYVQGRFADENCSEVAQDADCIQIDETEFQRKPVDVCLDEDLLSFQLASVSQEAFSPSMRSSLKQRLTELQGTLKKTNVPFDAAAAPSGVEATKEVADGASETLPLRAEAVDFTEPPAEEVPALFSNRLLATAVSVPRNTTSMPPAAANCRHKNGVDDVQEIEGIASLSLGSLDEAKFLKLADAAKNGSAYLGYRFDVSIFKMGGGEVSQDVSIEFVLKDNNGIEKKKVTQTGFAMTSSYYTLSSLFEGIALDRGDIVTLRVFGELQAKCNGSTANGRQASIRVGARQFKVNF